MKKHLPLLAALVLAVLAASIESHAQRAEREPSTALRERIEQRFNVVPIANGIALTPKTRRGDVRLIEISDTVAINGAPVTGSELRERVGADADAILQLSYMAVAERQALFGTRQEAATAPPPAQPTPEEALERTDRRLRAARGDRINIFGDVRVREDEEVAGQAVAVLGSVHIDGEVGDQVVAVLGSVELGPKAVVRGDIVSVGGRVHRAEGAQVRGGVTEVAIGDIDLPDHLLPMIGGVGLLSLGDFGAVPRLIGSTFRLLLLITLGVMAYLVARRSVESSAERVQDNPVKATFVGLAAGLLIGPLLFLTSFVLVLTIIGIPLLLLIPFIIAFLVLLALVGFTGTALAIGQWASRRFGIGGDAGITTVILGILVILMPLMLARLIALGGWATAPFSFTLGAAAFGLELLVWAAGFGAVLSNTFSGWRARRSAVPATT